MSKVKKVFKAVKKIASSPLGSIGLGLATGGLGGALGGGLLGGVVSGAASGALSGGGLKGALLGGATGGLGSYISGGGSIPGLGSIGKNVPISGYGPSQVAPSGVLGTVSKGLGAITGAGTGGGSSMFGGNSLSNILSGINSYNTQEDMEDKLLEQQRKSQAALLPYQQAGLNAQQQLSQALAQGFDPTKIGDDAGYQFNLEQGNKALDRAASARGGFYSGRALKDAQEFGTNLANNYMGDYYNRWANTNGQLANLTNTGLNAASGLTGVYDNMGNIKSNAAVGMNNTLSSLLSGAGARTIIGWNTDGTPIYAEDKTETAV